MIYKCHYKSVRVLYEPAQICLFRPYEFNKYAVTELIDTNFFLHFLPQIYREFLLHIPRISLRKWYEQFNQLLTCARIINTIQPSARR
jgi:hypothetical protein